MIHPTVNPNSIDIPLIATGCLKSGFNSIYPIHLNGIIRPDEFQESIENINRALASRKAFIIVGSLFFLCVIAGMTLFVFGGITSVISYSSRFAVFFAVGFAVFVVGMIVLSTGCCIIQSKRTSRLQQAVASESMKYLTRSPPCSWRLNVNRAWGGNYVISRRGGLTCRLVIEIGNVISAGNEYNFHLFSPVVRQPVSFLPQEEINIAPPPYYHAEVSRFCSNCGILRSNSIANFCSTCGHPFSTR